MGLPRRGDDRGVSAIELAVIGPSLLLLIFFVIQIALYQYARSVALQTARDAVSQLRLAKDRPAYDGMTARVHGQSLTFAQQVGSGALTGVDERPSYYQDHVLVRVTGHSISLVPGLSIGVSEQATGRWERFEDDR